MLLEGPVLFTGLASAASALAAQRVMAEIRGLQLKPVFHPWVLSMSRADITPVAGLSREGEREAETDVKPLPWLHCALVILLTSAFCYGLGYFVFTVLLHGRL